jgi:hypothetical protein
MSENIPQPDVISHQGMPQGSPYSSSAMLSHYSDEEGHSEAESEYDGFIEALVIDPYSGQNRQPLCHRRRDQVMLCTPTRGNHVCRRSVAILASEDNRLIFECEERDLSQVVGVSSGLHFFSYCTFNLDFGGIPPVSVPTCPPLEGLPEVTISAAEPTTTWRRVRTTSCPIFMQPPLSLVFNLERSLPTAVACMFDGPTPLSIMLQPCLLLNLAEFLPSASYHFMYISDVPEGGPLLSREGMRIVDV